MTILSGSLASAANPCRELDASFQTNALKIAIRSWFREYRTHRAAVQFAGNNLRAASSQQELLSKLEELILAIDRAPEPL